jgi:glutaconate CoA-transferase subunit A
MPPDYSMPAMEVVRELIRRKAKHLRLLGVPILGISADLLIGAGCVDEIESSAVSLGEAGLAPRFSEAIENNLVKIKNSTCPAIHSALQAAEKGVPFMPLAGIGGSDLMKERTEWQAQGDVVLVPAIRPDVALFHAPRADRAGNVLVGRSRDLLRMAQASRETFVTVEEVVDGDLLADRDRAAGVIPAVYVTRIAVAKRGAAPLGLAGVYDADEAALARYAQAARTAEDFRAWLDAWLEAVPA